MHQNRNEQNKMSYCHNESNRLDPDAQLIAAMDFVFLSNLVLKTFNGNQCVDGNQLIACFDAEGKPKYPTAEYDPSTQHLRFPNKDNKCLQADLQKLQLTVEPCIENDETQQWIFEYRVVGKEKRIIDFPFTHEVDKAPARAVPEGTRKVQTTTSGTPTDRTEISSSTLSTTTTKKQLKVPHPQRLQPRGIIFQKISQEELRILKQEHREYVDHKFNDNLNTLAEEVKEVYCQDLRLKNFNQDLRSKNFKNFSLHSRTAS